MGSGAGALRLRARAAGARAARSRAATADARARNTRGADRSGASHGPRASSARLARRSRRCLRAPPPPAPGPPGAAAAAPAPPRPAAPPIAPPAPAIPGGVAARPRGGAALHYLGAHNLLRSSYFDWTTLTSAYYPEFGKRRDLDLSMDFSFVPRVSFVDTRDHWAWVGTAVRWSVILSTPHAEVDEPSVALADLPIEAGYHYTLLDRDDGLAVLAGPRLSVALPTSTVSRASGVHARTTLGLDALANVPLSRGDWLNGVFMSGTFGWQHLFSEATTAVSQSQLRDPSGRSLGTDQISGRYLVRDRLVLGTGFWLNVWGDLAIGTWWGLSFQFRDAPPSDVCVNVVNATCAPVEPRSSPEPTPYTTVFDVSLSYAAAELLWITFGYDNTVSGVDERGQMPSAFHGPDAQLYLSAMLLLDGAFARATAP